MTGLLLALVGTAHAQVPPPEPEPVPAPTPATPATEPTPATAATAPSGGLGRETEEPATLFEGSDLKIGNLTRMDDARIRLAGYLDLGFFDAMGDGVAYARDDGKVLYPHDADVPWVFYGDPWSNPVNSQGESSDLGLDRTNLPRFDPIASGGKPTFLVNSVNQSVLVTFKKSVLIETSINFEPRDGVDLGRLGSSGDQVDLDLAYAEWVPSSQTNFHLFVGKFEPTFGIEYRARKASERFGITPSLIARYTTQPPIGLKLRGGLPKDLLLLNVAFTNGQSSTELFAHFYNEIDDNIGKTVSGRLSTRLPLPFFVEFGGSGSVGSQDNQPDDTILHTQAGADARIKVASLTLEGEWLAFSRADGGGTSFAPSLDAKGWYAQARYLVLPGFAVYGRADRRQADLRADTNLYHSNTLRYTAGVRFDITFNVLLKAEFLHIDEVHQPELDDDLVTTSLVLRY